MFIYQEQSSQWNKATLDFNLNKLYTLSTSQTWKYLSNGEHSLLKNNKNPKSNFFTNNSNNKKHNSWCCWEKLSTHLTKIKSKKMIWEMIHHPKSNSITASTWKEKEKGLNSLWQGNIRPSERQLKMTYFCSKIKYLEFSL